MIERITSKKDITTILQINDPRLDKQVLSRVNCSKVEWVQGLERYIESPSVAMWAIKENDKIKYYFLAFCAIVPPFCRDCAIMYQNFYGAKDDKGNLILQDVLELCKTWAREKGASRIIIQTDYPGTNSKLGFKEDGHTMSIKL